MIENGCDNQTQQDPYIGQLVTFKNYANSFEKDTIYFVGTVIRKTPNRHNACWYGVLFSDGYHALYSECEIKEMIVKYQQFADSLHLNLKDSMEMPT